MADTLTAPAANPVAEEAAFIDSFVAKLESGAGGQTADKAAAPAKPAAQAKDDKKDAGKGTTEKKDAKPASDAKGRAASPAKAGTSASDTDDEEIASPGAAEDESDKTDGDDKVDSDTDGKKDDADADDDEVEDADDDVDDEVDDDDDEEVADGGKSKVDDDKDDGLAEETRAALKAHGLKMTLDDIPAEARPLVKAKLAQVDAAFSRAQADARAYRKEEAAFRAEQKFIADHPELAIVELIEKYPEAFEKANALLTKTENEDGKKVVTSETAEARRTARASVDAEIAKVDRIFQRADEIKTYAERACQKLNLPFEVVQNAIVIALNEKPDDKRDLTTEEMDAVITSQARILGRRASAIRREARKSAVQERTRDRKVTSPAGKGGSGGTALAPAGAKPPKNDQEFASYMESKHASRK